MSSKQQFFRTLHSFVLLFVSIFLRIKGVRFLQYQQLFEHDVVQD